MLSRFLTIIFLPLIMLACAPEESAEPIASGSVAADTILTNAKIYTLDENQPKAAALAIRGNTIESIGDVQSVMAWRGENTEVIDLNERVIFPGFHDQHVHPVFAGIQARRCVIPQGSSLNQIRTEVKACVDKAEPGEWIQGGQWDASAIGEIPNRSMIDDITPDNPVLLGDTSEHSAWVNSKALSIANVDGRTADPEGGIIERDSEGNPTGVLREEAVLLVRRFIPESSDKEVMSALQWGLQQMLKQGITSFTEASTGYVSNVKKEINAFAELADAGKLKQRTRICIPWTPQDEQIEEVLLSRKDYERQNLKLDCIKMFLDGVPTDSHTAAMLEPYEGTVEGRDDKASRYGILQLQQAQIKRAVKRFDAMGITVKFHSSGDAAVRAALNAIEYAREENGFSGLRHNPGHCTFVAPEDFALAKKLQATLEFSPYLWSPSPINFSISSAVGEARVKRVWPFRDALASGALVVPGSDWSVVPSVNPWIAIESLVTRELPGGSEESFGKPQAITLEEAIKLFTINSARHMGNEATLGKLRPGMLADMVIVDRDPFAIPSTELHEVKVTHTIINGEIVYQGIDD